MSGDDPNAIPLQEALRRAHVAWQGGDLRQVEHLCRAILQARPEAFEALHLMGMLALRLGRADDASRLFARAAAVHPASVEARYNLGVALHSSGRHPEALEAYGAVIALRPDFAEAYTNRGVVFRDLGRNAEALADYERAIALGPSAARACNNRGVILRELRRPDEALASYDRAIAAKPDFAEAHCNRGAVLADLGRHGEALASQERALALAPNFADAWVRRGVALTDLGDHGAAVESLRRALDLDPKREWLEGQWLHAKLRVCDWSDVEADIAHLRERVAKGERATLPFPFLALVDDPALHRRAAETWAVARANVPVLPPAPRPRANPARLHIGYFSADFHEHATSYLMAGVLEAHDRGAFEVTAFSFGPRTHDAMQQRIERAVERFVDAHGMTDEAVVRLARELHVDIAVDLKGYTDHARTGIFAMRAAPVQVNYLGYPGTMAAPFMDTIFVDETVVPPSAHEVFTERVAYLPGCYQVNDAHRAVAEAKPTRADVGLPDEGFVYCCFNNPFKILPAAFDSWVRILGRVPGSVLWLLADHELTMRNLREEAKRRGIDPARLVFAPRVPQPEHMARFPLADAFLDTFPYNAHTTASDALWSGVPVVTRMGKSFASRVAASLLRAVGLEDLGAESRERYEALAVRLANDASWRSAIRERLDRGRTEGRLFDPVRHARHLEAAFRGVQ